MTNLTPAQYAEALAEPIARIAAMADEALAIADQRAADDPTAITMYAQYTGLRRALDELRRITAS